MVVQHNMQAMNANRMLNVTTNAQSKSSEKLSSGYRINRAADDAAGLSISEKMRKQIRGLDQASSNAEDGVSAVQTAEGALTEVHDMLQRMNALAVQAANGTNSESDRQSIQDEIDQLTTEIDRVAETTKFNETYLLKGSTSGTSSKVNVAAHDAGLDGTLVENGNGTTTFTLNDALEVGDTVTIGGTEYNIVEPANVTDYTVYDASRTYSSGDTIVRDGETYTYYTTSDGVTNAGWYTDEDKASDTASKVVTGEQAGDILTTGGTTATVVGSGTTSLAGTALVTKPTAFNENDTVERDGVTWTRDSVGAWKDEDGNTYSGNFALQAGDLYTSSITDETVQIDDTGITTAENVYNYLASQTSSVEVKIYDSLDGDSVTYTLGATTNESAGIYTAADIASKLTGDQYITIGSANYYVVPTESDDDNDISINDAYGKMADELAKASSIGTDSGSEATVINNGDGSFTINQGTVEVKDSLSFSLHVGADADMTNKINVNIESMSAAGLGIQGLTVAGDDVTNATYAIDAIADAIAKVSEQRSALGAVQNRLEHTISNLDNVVENTTSAESRIRDTDMAEEMVEYSKNNILAQAGQSMLAQANQSTQGVLSLLG